MENKLIGYHSIDNLYIAENGNSCIRKVTNSIITVIAGTGAAGYSGDGGDATSAILKGPEAVAVDSLGIDAVSHHIDSVI